VTWILFRCEKVRSLTDSDPDVKQGVRTRIVKKGEPISGKFQEADS
jgi:hypothetical protein